MSPADVLPPDVLPSDARTAGAPVQGAPAEGDFAAASPDPSQDILEATKQVARLLKESGHRFALAGSVAAYAHGVARRALHDTDFCVLRADSADLADVLGRAGLHVWHPPEDWLIKAEFHGVPIDLIFALSDRPVTPELLDRATVLPVDSMWMPVLSPTDLMNSQLTAFSEHHCDFGAVLPIARTLRERVDWQEVRSHSRGLPMAEAFLFLLERLHVVDPPEEERP